MHTFKSKEVKVRKQHWCVWCGEIIEKKSIAFHRVYIEDGFHIECKGKGKVWVNFGERDRVLEECQTCSGRGEITL